MSAPVCPECAQGKHPNCVGSAWDDTLDAPVPCGCDCRRPDARTGQRVRYWLTEKGWAATEPVTS